VHTSYGTGNSLTNVEAKPTQQEGDKKPNPQMINLTENLEGGSEPLDLQSIDSTEDDSVSKYNFIFYFIYKMKYNEAQESGEIF
jgi:hypothetical protein